MLLWKLRVAALLASAAGVSGLSVNAHTSSAARIGRYTTLPIPPRAGPLLKAPEDGVKAKLEQEASALSLSWKSARLLLYAAFGAGSLAGLSTAVPAYLGGDDAEAAGVVVDALTLVAAVAGALIDGGSSELPLAATTAATAAAPVTLPDWSDSLGLRLQLRLSNTETKDIELGTLLSQAKQTVVLLVGPAAWVREALIAARCDATLFRSGDVLLVPYVTGAEDAPKGFGSSSSWSEMPFVAEPQEREAWSERIGREVAAAEAQGADVSSGVVVVIGRDGEVSQRRLGAPEWRPFLIRLAPERFDAAEVRRVG